MFNFFCYVIKLLISINNCMLFVFNEFTNFQNHFPDNEFQILFVLNAVMLDAGIGSKGLSMVNEILIDDSNLISTIFKEQSLVVPSLFILLGSAEEGIRSQTLKILAVLTDSLCTGFYRPLVEELLNYSTEILLDHQ